MRTYFELIKYGFIWALMIATGVVFLILLLAFAFKTWLLLTSGSILSVTVGALFVVFVWLPTLGTICWIATNWTED